MRNFESYYKRMGANMEEKLDFILPHLDSLDLVIDFGCANGATTELMASMFPNIKFIGIDLEPVVQMNKKYNEPFKNIDYMTIQDYLSLLEDYSEVADALKVGLILSSVTHELFTFLDKKEVMSIIFEGINANMIFIRDMYWSFIEGAEKTAIIPSRKLYGMDLFYENEFGAILYKEFVHFLLKQRYKDNWEEEIKENYFATPWSDIILEGKFNGYVVEYDNPYMNEYLKFAIYDETSYHIENYTNTTHRKLILKRN